MKYILLKSVAYTRLKILLPLIAVTLVGAAPALHAAGLDRPESNGPEIGQNLRPDDPPYPITRSPLGFIDRIEPSGTVAGWALDPDATRTAIEVLLTIDGGGSFFVTANLPRPDVNHQGYPGNHGFEFTIPDNYRDGQFHTIRAFGIDVTDDPDAELSRSPQTFWFFPRPHVEGDYNGDGVTDIAVFRSSDRTWYIRRPDNSFAGIQFGLNSDRRVPGDYDGDGKTNVAVFRASEANWYIGRADGTLQSVVHFGLPGDIPVPGDYDGNGTTDIAVFRPSDNTWYIRRADGSFYGVPFGSPGDQLVPADYDGDRATDIAVWRPSEGRWYLLQSTAGLKTVHYGQAGDVPVPSDYDGDGRAEIAVVRPTTFPEGTAWVWYIARTDGTQINQFTFGRTTDRLVPADYDGDRKSDIAVYRPSDGTWYIARLDGSFYGIQFGAPGDEPVSARPIN